LSSIPAIHAFLNGAGGLLTRSRKHFEFAPRVD
jgi:hypothetical protein